jgi:phage terminase large subunit-like protein
MNVNVKKYPNCARGHKYALDIVAGKITACVFVKGACEKYLREVEDDRWYFDWDAAEKYLRTVQKFEHVIGHWKTKNIVYEPWQCWIWMCIMGFMSKVTGFRRYRIAHIEIARGNAKSAMASQAALYFLAFDNPNGNQISTVATKKEQARIVLDSARAMARKNESFRKHTGVQVLAHSVVHKKSNSVLRALASEANGLDGLQDILSILDELHAMKRDVFEVVTSGMSKRADSLTLCITTAGQDVHSVGCSQSAYAKKVCLGDVEDEQFFAVVYTLDDGDDWEEEKNWIKSNPNLEVSVDITTLRAKVAKAIETPADEANIKIKHMNIWIAEAKAFYDQKIWDKCADPTLKIENFKGKSCRMGLDLASHIDITSDAIIFREDGIYTIFDKSYLPEDTVNMANNVLYDDCIARGHLIKTPGAAINYDFIRAEIEQLAKDHRVLECGYDAWNATETAQKLSNKIEMVKVAMNVANLSEPMKKLDALMRSGKLRHNGSPLLRWCLGNVIAKEDHNGNVFPRKSHEKLKIDPIVAILICLALWLQDEDIESVYETRGIRRL